MFTKSIIETRLEKEIISSLNQLALHEATSEEYGIIVEHITKLYKLKSEDRLKPPSLDTVLAVSANIFGIFWLTRYEREHVINSKALGFVMKPR